MNSLNLYTRHRAWVPIRMYYCVKQTFRVDPCAACFLKNKFIYLFLFLAVLGLRCCVWAFSSCGEQGLLSVAVRGLLIVVSSLVAEHGL